MCEWPASSGKSPGSGEWIIPGFVLCRTAHFSLALSVLYQGIVSTRVTGLKDPLNLASILSWQTAMARVMEECLHMSDPRNIFSVLSDKAQSQIGGGEEHRTKCRLAWGLVSALSWIQLRELELVIEGFLSMHNKPVRCDSLALLCQEPVLGWKVASSLSTHVQNLLSQTEWERSTSL